MYELVTRKGLAGFSYCLEVLFASLVVIKYTLVSKGLITRCTEKYVRSFFSVDRVKNLLPPIQTTVTPLFLKHLLKLKFELIFAIFEWMGFDIKVG